MANSFLGKILERRHQARTLNALIPVRDKISAREGGVHALSDADLRAQTGLFRERLAAGAGLDDVLVEAFAVVREAGLRTLNMRHFDVQLLGGMVLHHGQIAEMKTGEGKTLVATLAAYLNALSGKGVHVVTVNDYLARRDSEWMGRIYRFLGLTVGVIQHELNDQERQRAYACDITYGTNNEFGFDYLRDNMKFELSAYVQRGHNFAIVDEVDSILIDEARTPLIISGPADESTDLYYEVDRIIPKLAAGAVTQGDTKAEDRERLEATGDYIVDEKHKTVTLTELGMAKAEKLLAHRLSAGGLYEPVNMPLLHHVNQALRAHTLFRRDVDYMIKDGEVVIVDEFTGRLMPGRRWSDGLHQAVEAKEKVKIERENQTLATVTFQNYFRKYKKLSGMTGTAETEAEEFAKIYNLDVVVVPPNRTLRREELADSIYRTVREKYDAIVADIREQQEKERPTLVGTVSIEKSEKLAGMLRRTGVRHVVLNAKFHAQEAEIVAQAGRAGAVTIATNMAGRGTDILLGGNAEFMARQKCLADELAERLPKGEEKFIDDEEFVYFHHIDAFYRVPRVHWERWAQHFKAQCEAEHERVVLLGGLHIIGTERHEARRIDNQLRGRAGRQGDPGSSRFYLSLEDDLMRIFGSDRISGLMERLGMEEGVPIEHRMVTKAIERAQKQVEGQNFSIRKHLLEYDDVMNKQRESIYALRRELLEGRIAVGDGEVLDSRGYLFDLGEGLLDGLIDTYCPEGQEPGEWDLEALRRETAKTYGLEPADLGHVRFEGRTAGEMQADLWGLIQRKYEEKEASVGRDLLQRVERDVMLQVVDTQWKDHLYSLDHLKEGIGLRGYGQRDPLVEYKKESFALFQDMKARIDEETVRYLFWLKAATEESAPAVRRPAQRRAAPMTFSGSGEGAAGFFGSAEEGSRAGTPAPARTGGDDAPIKTVRRDEPKVGRNDPCPCGSGKKYKKCHGAQA
jgi:preprotein translocase subunit SecA